MSESALLPNCLLKNRRSDLVLSGTGEWFYLFCANCGKDGGRVRSTEIPLEQQFAFYLCDPCAEKYGAIAGMLMVPDEAFWAKVKEAQIEKYGRELEPWEVVEELKDENSMMSKLARERPRP